MAVSIDIDHDLPVFSPVCFYCQNWDRENHDIPGTCKAFKNGIPEKIWTGENEHTKSYPGDNGIRFEDINA